MVVERSVLPGDRTCNVCIKTQPMSAFPGRRATCYGCRQARTRVLQAAKVAEDPDRRKCNGCNTFKSDTEFGDFKTCEKCRKR
jgi:hypothetical protein